MIVLLAAGWVGVGAACAAAFASRLAVARRARMLGRHRRSGAGGWWPHRAEPRPVAVARQVLTTPWRRRAARRREDALLAELPVAVDLVGVAVGAGSSPRRAVETATRWGPPKVQALLEEVAWSTALGASFDDALRAVARNAPAVGRLTETLRTSARLGSPAGPSLDRLAEEVRAEVRRRAESRARTVPVRLLFPLVFCVLPAFALLTVVPVLLDGMAF